MRPARRRPRVAEPTCSVEITFSYRDHIFSRRGPFFWKRKKSAVLDNTKIGYENMVKTMVASQEKAEQMVRESFEKSPIPEEAKKAIFATMDAYKEGCTQLHKFFKENYANIENVVETKETEEIIEA